MKVKNLFCITTCRRDLHLIQCLEKIKEQYENDDYLILIFQDGNGEYQKSMQYIQSMNFKWYFWSSPHGKENFYIIHNEIYKITKEFDFDFCHHIQDDCLLVPDYKKTVEMIFETQNIECLNTLTLNCMLNQFYRQEKKFVVNNYDVYSLQRLDCNYVVKREFFDRLDWHQVPISVNYDYRNGSGVGSHTTIRYINAGGIVHNILPSLLLHIGYDSQIGNKMNYRVNKSVLKNDYEFTTTQKQKIGYKYHWL